VAGVPACLRRPTGGPDCLPYASVHPRFSRASLEFVVTRPFPRPQTSDTIPIAGRPPRSKAGQDGSVQPVLPGGPIRPVAGLCSAVPAG
jgi:hypothetical protein